jgi:7,8-dihydropterin-6-yl-methyl-4-(beta-D-ribofuranosyl)aminobenzene 5'-phosphate synthase
MADYLGNVMRRGALGVGGMPQVEGLSLRVVTDAYHHAFERSTKIGEVQVERFFIAFSPTKAPPKTLRNEWGLAVHAESTRGKETRRVLIDFGFTAETLNHNLGLLGIDCGALDALVLSHGHYDHFGGMAGFLKAQRGKLKARLPLYLGGEECFCARESTTGNGGYFGVLDRKAIAAAKLKVVTADQPLSIAGHAFSTGRIPSESFERVLSPTRMKVGMAGGLGCAAKKLAPEKRSADVMPDDFQHEHATCYHVKHRGLVVITSCGHRGVVNSVKAAMKVSGEHKVHAVIGGFHLAPHPAEYVAETVKALKEIGPDYVIPMHCTGEAFLAMAQQEMPGKVIRSSTGSRYTFG